MKKQADYEIPVSNDFKRRKTESLSILPEITSYDCLQQLKLAAPVEIQHPKTHFLKLKSEGYRIKDRLIPYTDSNKVTFPLNSWGEIVPAINRAMKKCMNGRMVETLVSDDTHKPGPIPNGMHMFEAPQEISDSLSQNAFKDAQNIYWNPKHKSNKKIHVGTACASSNSYILFYPGPDNGKYKIKDVLQILFAEAPFLAKYIMIYVSAVKDILQLDEEELNLASMSMVHYDPMGNISPHVDTVFIFDGTLGPIFTVAMGPSEKMIDMLPVMFPDTYQPVRVFSNPNEIMLMDGIARTLWAHGKPLGCQHEQISLVLKFPELKRKIRSTPFDYKSTTLSIPHYYVTPSESRVSAPD
jgi:hypothetical protein